MNSFLYFPAQNGKTFSIWVVSFSKFALYRGVFRNLSNIYDGVIFKYLTAFSCQLFENRPVIDVWQGLKYASDPNKKAAGNIEKRNFKWAGNTQTFYKARHLKLLKHSPLM